MKALLWAEGKDAKGRQGTRTDLNIPVNLPECLSGDARDKVGDLFGVSGSTVQKQVAVVDKIEELDSGSN